MQLPAQLLLRKVNSHKGDYGHIFILAGCARFSGAALLCAHAAMRAGAGLVTLGVPESIHPAIIKNKIKEVMTLPLPETKEGGLSLKALKEIRYFLKKADVLIIGPGLGQERSTYTLVRKVIQINVLPTIIDADALGALRENLNLLKKYHGKIILTPHEKEFSNLFKVNLKLVKKNRKFIAKKYAKYYNNIIVLKGHRTIVTGGANQIYINKTGNPGMATAGSGDVLSGIIGAFLGQGLDTFKAAKFATYIHGLAGEIGAKDKTQMGLIASDIIERIPDAIKKSSFRHKAWQIR